MRVLKFLLVFAVGWAVSCISPLEIKTDREVKLLVVEGFISTLPGPYFIRLTTSARYGSVFDGQVRPEPGADVWIRDSEGNSVFLIDDDFGNYRTPSGFTGQVGETYVLNIRTAAGVRYASLPETIQPVPELDSIAFAYKKQPSVDPLDFISGVEVYAVWQDPPDEDNFYIWRNSGIFFVKTFPELFVAPGPFSPIPSPKDCCSECWVTERNADFSITIASDNDTNGKLKTELVAFVEDNGSRFTDKYKVSIQQSSLSKDAYKFFVLLKNQKGIDGDIFDPPPATIRGNIINLDDPEANVIGYFYASDATEASAFIERSVLEETQPAAQINDDCRVLSGATIIRPNDW